MIAMQCDQRMATAEKDMTWDFHAGQQMNPRFLAQYLQTQHKPPIDQGCQYSKAMQLQSRDTTVKATPASRVLQGHQLHGGHTDAAQNSRQYAAKKARLDVNIGMAQERNYQDTDFDYGYGEIAIDLEQSYDSSPADFGQYQQASVLQRRAAVCY